MSPSETRWRGVAAPHANQACYSHGTADSLICVKSESFPLANGNVNGDTALVSFTPRLGDITSAFPPKKAI